MKIPDENMKIALTRIRHTSYVLWRISIVVQWTMVILNPDFGKSSKITMGNLPLDGKFAY